MRGAVHEAFARRWSIGLRSNLGRPLKQPLICGASRRISTDPKSAARFDSLDLVKQRGDAFLYEYPRKNVFWRLLSKITVLSVVTVCKLFVKLRHRTSVLHVERLRAALEQAQREQRGLITIMNHVSILDDPLVWGAALPLRTSLHDSTTRWALGARDICFKNRAESLFFSLGRVLSVERFGRGPDQPAIDCAVSLISRGQWVHIFPEGFVHQPYEPYSGTLRYFHWGVSRLVLESGPNAPLVLPIYARGLDNVFPEDKVKRALGYGFNVPLVYNFGQPVDAGRISEYREKWNAATSGEEQDSVRSEVASFLRKEGLLEAKKEVVKLLEEDNDPRLNTPSFWRGQTLIKTKGLSTTQKKEKKEHRLN